MGIPVARPAEEWRRSEPRDQRDARIEELERQLGAMPRLSLSLLAENENAVVFEPISECEIPHEFCERVANAILERNPGISQEQLLRRHNLENTEETKRGLRIPSRFSVSVKDVERYCRDYEEFKDGIMAWSRKIPNVLSQLDFAAPIQLEIANNGESFADDVEIAVSVSTGFAFTQNRFVQSYLEMRCKAPEPPSRMGEFSHLPTLFEHHGIIVETRSRSISKTRLMKAPWYPVSLTSASGFDMVPVTCYGVAWSRKGMLHWAGN